MKRAASADPIVEPTDSDGEDEGKGGEVMKKYRMAIAALQQRQTYDMPCRQHTPLISMPMSRFGFSRLRDVICPNCQAQFQTAGQRSIVELFSNGRIRLWNDTNMFIQHLPNARILPEIICNKCQDSLQDVLSQTVFVRYTAAIRPMHGCLVSVPLPICIIIADYAALELPQFCHACRLPSSASLTTTINKKKSKV